jgi:hypothetical protein
MKITITLLMAFFLTVTAISQNYPTPESFLVKIPAYPSTAKNVQVLIDSLQKLETAIQAAQKDYSDAQKKIMTTMDQTAREQAYKKLYKDVDSAKMKEMQKKQQEDMQSLADTSIDGVAKRLKNFDKEINRAQSSYNEVMRKGINPVDSAIAAEMKNAKDTVGSAKIATMISKRTSEYQNIMANFLIGEKAAFQLLFKDYSEFLNKMLVPMLDRIELDQTKIFNLSYTPHANALGAIEGYLGKYKHALQNLKDYKEWSK